MLMLTVGGEGMHVFARVTGFGLTLIPMWPYRFHRDGEIVTVTHWTEAGERTVTVTPATAEPVGAAQGPVEEVLDVRAGPQTDSWRIETSRYSVAWPSDFDIDSPAADAPSTPFDLFGPDEALIYLAGPYPKERIRPFPEYAAKGQTIVAHVREPRYDLLRLDYLHDGAQWRQSYHFVDLSAAVLVVKTQSLAKGAEFAEHAAEVVALSARRPDYT
jgi:hypothetical protein